MSFSILKPSLSVEPVSSVTLKPSPNSIPLMAPIDITAFARFASNLSNTVSPTPAGMPSTKHSIMPPTESISFIFSFNNSAAFVAASLSGMYIGLFGISSFMNLL